MQDIFDPRIMDSKFTLLKHKMGIMCKRDGVKTKQECLCCKNTP